MSRKNNMKSNKVKSYSSDSDEMMSLFKVLGVVVVVLVLFYFVFAIASGEISFGKKKIVIQEDIQNVEILAGTTFNKSQETYYVLMYDFNADDSISYENLYNIFQNNYRTNKLYLVDLSKKFNSEYVVDDRNLINISSVDLLKVVNGTLIKVENGKGVSYSVGIDEIKKTLFN